jgi:RimJ/RimL family protein N-acetyltransferase
LPSFQAYRAIPELGRYQSWSAMPESEALGFLVRMSEVTLFTRGQWLQLGIAELTADRLVGDIGLFLSDDGLTGEIGFTLEPAAQGRGIATAAVRETLRLLFECTKVREVMGITDIRNVPSVRLLERSGFQYRESRAAIFRGEHCSEAVFMLSRNDGG